MKPKSDYTKNREGTYDVQFTTKNKFSDHIQIIGILVPKATSKKDAVEKASKSLNTNLEIVKIVIVFLGVVTLIAALILN